MGNTKVAHTPLSHIRKPSSFLPAIPCEQLLFHQALFEDEQEPYHNARLNPMD
jgi:hypothetical protein